ncbi:MAG: aldo/keto reductase [Candidatus Obscuribacterales bacterium]|nr:aldo/keto reductase [Candidatus Obscuribacterales bacterium]
MGFSDTPAWKTTQAQLIATMRGWAPLVALQIEYSLIERTVEGELVPMALEMGLGVTPWSPLKQGVLAGKYKREDAETVSPNRGEWVKAHLTDRNFDIVETLAQVADQLDSTPARVALAWLLKKPAISSPIIGARTVEHLEDNIKSLELELNREQVERLDEVSKPSLNFPHEFVKNAGPFGYGGTTINGETFDRFALAPTEDSKRYEELMVKV